MKQPTYRLITGGVGVFVLVGLIGLYVWANRPVVATGSTASVEPEPTAATIVTPIETDYFVTKVTDLALRPRAETSASNLASVLAGSSKAMEGTQLAITVKRLPIGGISEVSDVNFRNHTTDQYDRVTQDGIPEGAVMFRAPGRYEVSLFWPKGGNYAAIVLTGRVDRRTQLDEQLSGIVSNWQWL